MFDVGGGELILIILAVIVLFGPKKLPEIMKTAAKGIREFKKAQTELNNQINVVKQEVDKEINDIDKAAEDSGSDEKSSPTAADDLPDQLEKKFDSYKPIETKLSEKDESKKECH